MYTNVFEGTKLNLSVKIKVGFWKTPKASFIFIKGGEEQAPVEATVENKEAKTELELANVGDDDESYTLDYRVEADGETYNGTQRFKVWPKNVKVKLSVDVDGTATATAGIPFRVKQQGLEVGKFSTGDDGTWNVRLPMSHVAEIEPISPYEITAWTKNDQVKGRNREGTAKENFKARIKSPRSDDAPMKQCINLVTQEFNGRDGRGREVEILVMGEGDDYREGDEKVAKEGKKVYVKMTVEPKTARTSPKPVLKDVQNLVKTQEEKEQTAHVLVGADNLAKFKVDLGLAGGDKITIKVGGTKTVEDDKLVVENWRMIEFETLMPTPGTVSDYTKWGDAAGLPADCITMMDTKLAEAFVNFSPKEDKYFVKADLPAAGAHNIYDGAYWKKDAGKKVVAITLPQAKAMLSAKATSYGNVSVVTMIWVDHLFREIKDWAESFMEIDAECERATSLKVFEKAPAAITGFAHGAYGIKALTWGVTHWKDGADWKELAADTDPGWAYRYDGAAEAINDEVTIKKHIEFVTFDKIKIKLPTDGSKGPGKRLTVDGGKLKAAGKEVKIGVYIEGVGALTGINGAASGGDIWMNTYCGEAVPKGMARVIMHELGHNMGQGYGAKTTGPLFGRPTAVPGIAFGARVPGGDIYEGKGHQGTHCAAGVAGKDAATYSGKAGTCLMYGADNMRNATDMGFCENCKKYITAEDLSSIRKNWKV